jgi:ABC-type multidrug transport system ATPase subunit
VASSPAVAVSGLTRAYSETTGIFDVGFEVPAGRVMALLGPNGAGKTTALRVLSTLLRPDGGTVRVGGIDALAQPDRVQALIGRTRPRRSTSGSAAGRT